MVAKKKRKLKRVEAMNDQYVSAQRRACTFRKPQTGKASTESGILAQMGELLHSQGRRSQNSGP